MFSSHLQQQQTYTLILKRNNEKSTFFSLNQENGRNRHRIIFTVSIFSIRYLRDIDKVNIYIDIVILNQRESKYGNKTQPTGCI